MHFPGRQGRGATPFVPVSDFEDKQQPPMAGRETRASTTAGAWEMIPGRHRCLGRLKLPGVRRKIGLQAEVKTGRTTGNPSPEMMIGPPRRLGTPNGRVAKVPQVPGTSGAGEPPSRPGRCLDRPGVPPTNRNARSVGTDARNAWIAWMPGTEERTDPIATRALRTMAMHGAPMATAETPMM